MHLSSFLSYRRMQRIKLGNAQWYGIVHWRCNLLLSWNVSKAVTCLWYLQWYNWWVLFHSLHVHCDPCALSSLQCTSISSFQFTRAMVFHSSPFIKWCLVSPRGCLLRQRGFPPLEPYVQQSEEVLFSSRCVAYDISHGWNKRSLGFPLLSFLFVFLLSPSTFSVLIMMNETFAWQT